MNSIKSIFLNLLIGFFISATFALALYYKAKVPSFLFDILPYIFFAITLVIIAISWHFNRNRFIFIILPLIMIQLGFTYLSAQKATYLFMYCSLVYPLHLLIFLLLKERGLFSLWGLLKIGFFTLEVGAISYLVYSTDTSLKEFINIDIFSISFYPLKDLSMAIGIFSLFVMSALVMFNRYLIYNSSFLVMLVTFYLGFYFIKTPHALEISFLSISIIILSVLIREAYRLAFYDELTSLPGRRALIEDMAKLGRKYSLAMCDIDFFKKFNDTYGHDTGDEVLKMVAAKLAEVSGGGKAYRYGGEEFVLLFPSKDVDESFIHTDTLRQNIASTPFKVRNKKNQKKIFINISSGIAQNSSKDKDAFGVMKRADNALYKAKKAGRNQVIKA